MNKPLETTSVMDDIDNALAAARQKYIESHPASRDAHNAAQKFMPGGNTRTVLYHDPFPLRVVKGSNSKLTDADGHEFLNLLGEYTAGLFGHNHPEIRKAIDQALDQGINLSAHNLHEIRLADLVCQRFPSIERVRFTNSGTEANLMAISTARYVSGRSKVMVFDGGYHGGLLYFGNGGIPINAPFDYLLGSYNDIETTRALIRSNQDDLACILVEPMMGSAGCIPGKVEFLEMLRSEADRCEAIVIFDEVMTSRLSGGGAQKLFDVMPDMTTLGKYIGGGMSFGAFGGRSDIMEIFNPESQPGIPHAGTFNNNSLSMAAGCAAMGRVFTPELADALHHRGEDLRNELNRIANKMQVSLQFTGIGSLMNLHATAESINCPADLKSSDPRIKQLVFFDLLESGYYIAPRGFIALMLSITDQDLQGFCNAFEQVISKRKPVLET
ncbi:MAG: aminotransferase class III-fold pyridoxal phosphate-dependent enzyme [Arenicellales bacterium]